MAGDVILKYYKSLLQGKGLGANEDGMSDAIKPNLKFDKHGLGHDIVKDIAFNWWDNVFNKALDTVGKSEKVILKDEFVK